MMYKLSSQTEEHTLELEGTLFSATLVFSVGSCVVTHPRIQRVCNNNQHTLDKLPSSALSSFHFPLSSPQ
jgi:hypothetical protein